LPDIFITKTESNIVKEHRVPVNDKKLFVESFVDVGSKTRTSYYSWPKGVLPRFNREIREMVMVMVVIQQKWRAIISIKLSIEEDAGRVYCT
jgi:hypothetical protein